MNAHFSTDRPTFQRKNSKATGVEINDVVSLIGLLYRSVFLENSHYKGTSCKASSMAGSDKPNQTKPLLHEVIAQHGLQRKRWPTGFFLGNTAQ
jgi:hypothetical protein